MEGLLDVASQVDRRGLRQQGMSSWKLLRWICGRTMFDRIPNKVYQVVLGVAHRKEDCCGLGAD